MFYAWIILGVLASGIALLIFLGFRSRGQAYIGMPPKEEFRPSKIDYKIHPEGSAADIKPAQNHQDILYKPIVDKEKTLAKYHSANNNKSDIDIVDGSLEIESDYEEALIMLREVKAMLLQGRPDRAIAHIRDATGVNHDDAARFVSDVESGRIG